MDDLLREAERYAPALWRFCRSLAYDRQEAEELMQDTWVRALERPEKLTAAREPLGLLYAMALRLWQSRQRKYARRRRAAPMEPLDEALPDRGEGVEEGYIAREEARLVRSLADRLPEKLRVPVALYYGSDMSVEQIAVLLGVPIGTVKSRLHRAREQLREELKAYDIGL